MDEKTFYNTPLGKLFLNFELFHTHATSAIIATFTVEDSNNPDEIAVACVERFRAARAEFVAEMMRITKESTDG